MDPNLVLLERTERVATIVLNRPEKRNALSPSLLTQFTDALNRIREEATRVGADHFLIKGISTNEDMTGVVREVLAKSGKPLLSPK